MKLYNGDCLIESDKIESGSVDLILTDLPYGTTACKWDSVIDFDLTMTLSSKNAVILTQPNISDFEVTSSDWLSKIRDKTTYMTNGSGSSSTCIVLDDVTGLLNNMALTNIQSGSVSGSPVITAIDRKNKTYRKLI